MSFDAGYIHFCDLLTLGEERFARGHYPAAAALANVAARYAFPGRVGLFGSPRLENLLVALGKQVPTIAAPRPQKSRKRARNVLHILSYGRPIGGDCRYAWRWIQQDSASRHSVAITTQADVKGIYEIPHILKEAVKSSGGFLRVLRAPTTRQLEQASELRMLCQGMDVIVLHIFPYDIIPVLALAAGCDASKIVFVNHSDHTFWIGSSVAHCIIHLRTQSAQFLKKRRGIDPTQSAFLPTPVVNSAMPVERTQAKLALGYDPNTVLLLTIASPFKYSSASQVTFLDLVVPVLTKFPQAVLLAVGPSLEGAWRSASNVTNGRIVPVGARWDNHLLYSAADAYLDSVPFSSITSLLEAGSYGVPLLGLRPANPELHLLGPGAPGIDNAMELANDAESYQVRLTDLIEDANFRALSGQRLRSSIQSLHGGSSWAKALNGIYQKLDQTTESRCLAAKEDTFESDALNSALAELYQQPSSWKRSLIGEYIGALPYSSRVVITRRLQRNGFGLCLLNFLPTPATKIIRAVGRRAKKLISEFGRRG
jgi:hypothetical protein